MQWIKKVYLYMVSLISLVIIVIAGIMLINLALRTWVFPKADNDIYYAMPMATCASPPVNLNDNSGKPVLAPECNNPDYQKQQEQQQRDQRSAQKQRDAAQAIAMLIVATPVFYYHWRLARKET